jgi:hypothetical protein
MILKLEEMPSPEIANTAMPLAAVADTNTKPVEQRSQKNSPGNYVKAIVLLVAIYSLILNRAISEKKNSLNPEPPVSIQKQDLNYVQIKAKSNPGVLPLMLHPGMSVTYSPNNIWKKK